MLTLGAGGQGVPVALQLSHAGDSVMGFLEMEGERIRIMNGRFSGGKLAFTWEIPGEGEVEMVMKLENESILIGMATTWEKGHEGEQIPVTALRGSGGLSGKWKLTSPAFGDEPWSLILFQNGDSIAGYIVDDGEHTRRIMECEFSEENLEFRSILPYGSPSESYIKWSLDLQGEESMKGLAFVWSDSRQVDQAEISAERIQ